MDHKKGILKYLHDPTNEFTAEDVKSLLWVLISAWENIPVKVCGSEVNVDRIIVFLEGDDNEISKAIGMDIIRLVMHVNDGVLQSNSRYNLDPPHAVD